MLTLWVINTVIKKVKMNSNIVLFLLMSLSMNSYASFNHNFSVNYKNNSYDVYRVSPSNKNIRFFWKNKQGERYFSFRSLKSDLARVGRKLVFATNAGIFEWGYTPLGLYVEKGRRINKLNRRRGSGNFYVKPNGVFYISSKRAGILSTRDYAKRKIKPLYATQSGPMLVRHAVIHRRFSRRSKSLYVRNGVGIDNKGRMVFVISRSPVNMYRFAEFFKKRMRCSNALYLDGSISKMYLPALKRKQLGGNFAVIIAVSEPLKK